MPSISALQAFAHELGTWLEFVAAHSARTSVEAIGPVSQLDLRSDLRNMQLQPQRRQRMLEVAVDVLTFAVGSGSCCLAEHILQVRHGSAEESGCRFKQRMLEVAVDVLTFSVSSGSRYVAEHILQVGPKHFANETDCGFKPQSMQKCQLSPHPVNTLLDLRKKDSLQCMSLLVSAQLAAHVWDGWICKAGLCHMRDND